MKPTTSSPSLAPVLALTLLCATGSGCIAVAAGAGVGYVISQEVLPNQVHTAQVADDVDHVWAVAQETLGYLIEPDTEIGVQDFPRQVTGKVDGAKVTVEVEAYDVDRTILRVRAQKYVGNDAATANEVMRAILDRLTEVE